jgi:DNA-binding response OmpR family regulator
MSPGHVELLTPRILIVDDERQIHASLRLRLGKDYELVCCFDASEALRTLAASTFDLCFVDIHMPKMDGFAFIESAQTVDSALGYVMLSAFDSNENLRRTIPLQVYDFIGKPLPERHEFEGRIPAWIARTRDQRRNQSLAQQAALISQDLDSARLDRDVELVASETARDALRQTANLLTTIHAHLLSAVATVASRVKADPATTHLLRNLEEARKTTDAAMLVAEGFFDSAYGSRDSSPALVDSGIHHAIDIATRMGAPAATNKNVDFTPLDERLIIPGVTGIEFLLMMIPAIAVALTFTEPGSTVRIHGEHLARLENATKDSRFHGCSWLNRKNALTSHPGILVTLATASTPFSRAQAEAWLEGQEGPLAVVTPRGLITGLKKSRGLLGMAIAPARQFRLLLALPA